MDFFRPFVEQGYEVIHINLGSGLSASHQNCCLAAAEMPAVHPVDSASLSTGTGLMVLEVADKVAAGFSVEEILAMIPQIRAHCHASFVVDTLEFLYKGGRCSALAMFGANLLQIKPSIAVSTEDGSMDVDKKYRGTLDKALTNYVCDKLEGRTDLKTDRIFITHSGISLERIQMVRELIGQYAKFDEILVTRAGCTISSHCGPNTLGILFMTKYTED
jgi:DegV family protein with EDD domain